MDTETTKNNGLVFDFAYELMDRHGQTYDYGSFLIKDVLAIEEPFFKEKISQYWTMVYKHHIKPLHMKTIRRVFNNMLARHIGNGSKIVICAYNAAFDITHLGQTCRQLTNQTFLKRENIHVQFLDLWHAWCMGCPVDYGYSAPMTPAGNIRTKAEDVYRYEAGIQDFEEKHIAYSDIIIEKVILASILRRKKKLPIVDDPKKFVSMPWRIAAQRCRLPLEARKARQQSAAELVETLPDITIKGAHFTGNPNQGFLPI